MSLVRQSYAAQERKALPPGALPSMAYQQPFLNADGFGVGWYAPDVDTGKELTVVKKPCVFTSLKPAWNDTNLNNLSEEVRSPLILAHIRAAGPSLPVSDATCHPFRAGRLLFAHNGMVGDYEGVRRALLSDLTDYAFKVAVRHGCIDSAVAFGVLLTELGVTDEESAMQERSADELCGALDRMIKRIVAVVAGRDESLLNCVVCDDRSIVACRFATSPSAGGLEDDADEIQPLGASLYLSVGSRWTSSPDDPENFRMRKGADVKCCTAILSSEPLTHVREEWLPIAPNSVVVCKLSKGQSQTVDVLLYPLRQGPPSSLATLLDGVGQHERCTAQLDAIPTASGTGAATGASLAALRMRDTWMSFTGHTEDVNCLAALFGGKVIAAGSMDGSLRLFDAASGQTLAVRKHSDSSGPVLALLALQGPAAFDGEGFGGMSPGSSKSNSPTRSPARSPAMSPTSSPRRSRKTWQDSVISPRLLPTVHQKLAELPASPLPRRRSCASAADADAGPLYVLLSTSGNELRVWDVTGCRSAGCQGEGSKVTERETRLDVEVPCLFCFRFSPNQGQLLALAGTLDSLVLGFQNTRVFRLRLAEGWHSMIRSKLRSRSTKHFTFNVNPLLVKAVDQVKASLPVSKSDARSGRKFIHNSLLEALHGEGKGHIGFVHCVAHEREMDVLASGGGDGRMIIWDCGRPRAVFPHGAAVLAMALCTAVGELFSGDARGRIRIWDCRAIDKGSRAVLSAGGAAVLSLAVARAAGYPHEKHCLLFSGDALGVLRLWDPRRCVVLRQLSVDLRCCAALCVLGEPSALPGGQLVSLACGGDCSGEVVRGDVVAPSYEGNLNEDADTWGCVLGGQDAGCRDALDRRLMFMLLTEFVGIKTISSDRLFERHLQKGTAWLSERFGELLGCTVRASGNCIAARCGWDNSRPLVVLYSHYDVVEPGGGWLSDPWEVSAIDGYLHGRGVSDNKGPLLAQIFGVRRYQLRQCALPPSNSPASGGEDIVMRIEGEDDVKWSECAPNGHEPERDCRRRPSMSPTGGIIPVNVLFIADGGAELGDVNPVRSLIREIKADGWLSGSCMAGVLVANSNWIDDSRPCICYGMRGVLDLEVQVVGVERDLHSGSHGGLMPEPMLDLMGVCSSLVDTWGKPTVPGLMDGVRDSTPSDLARLEAAAHGLSADWLRQRFGLQESAGPEWLAQGREPGLEALRRTWLTPSVSITEVGIGPRHSHGHHIAHRASCVVSVRTIPSQSNVDIADALRRHLRHEFAKRRTPNKLEIQTLTVCDWWDAKTDSLVYRAARGALAEAWHLTEEEILQVREGCTTAVLPMLEAEFGCEAVQLPLSQASDSVHLPNERMSEKVLTRAVDVVALTLQRLAELVDAEPPAAAGGPRAGESAGSRASLSAEAALQVGTLAGI